jgi:hypothetical protein
VSKLLQIFISSPGDVIPERRRAQLVIDKLAKSYARFFSIKSIQWEVEPMLASGHFQDQIIPPSETDILVLIVWSRLGTPLPSATGRRAYRGIDGRVPVTGTEWEFEDALAAQRARGAPDLLAYRKEADPIVSLRDKSAKAAAEAQWERLDAFWSRWFVDRGEFRAAFSVFADLDAFETKLEADLSRLIERRIRSLGAADRDRPAATWLEGSPFRGLEAFRFEHAAVFFGRSAMTKAAVEQLTTSAEAGRAFLLVLGASGAGKSSLAQAGILPALIGRGIVPEVGLWRRSVMRPGGRSGGPFASLAEALVAQTALPELMEAKQDAGALARHLRASADDPAYPIIAVLNQVEDSARARGELLTIETARIAIVVDQLEELFTTSEIAAADRTAFIICLDGLARSGRVYVIATMRSDYWHRTADTPLLVHMASGSRRLDLLAPTQDEIIEMIRQPAEAAGLSFDGDPTSGIKLDATLAAEAANEPGALPLLSFLLDELYKKDIRESDSQILTYKSMKELGGLYGAIATRADAAFTSMPPGVQSALPNVLRLLVTVSRSASEATARAAPIGQFNFGSPERALIDTLLDPQVRLLVAEGDGEGAYVSLAHEALITHWQRARRQIDHDREDLRTRAQVEEALSEWRKAPKRKQGAYFLRGALLTNSRELERRWGQELEPDMRAFIKSSRRRAYARIQLAVAALIVPLLLAGGAAFLWVDGRLNQARLLLQNGRLEEAQIEFLRLENNPISWVIPASDSARALATEFLDTGQVRTLSTLSVKPSPKLHDYETGQFEITRAALFAFSNSPSTPHLFRCSPAGQDCVSIALSAEWQWNNYCDTWPYCIPSLVRDGDAAFLVRFPRKRKDGLLAPLPSEGNLIVAPVPLNQSSSVTQIRQKGDSYYWLSSEELKSDFDSYVFSESPPIQMNDYFESGILSFKARQENEKDANEVRAPSVCDAGLNTCVTHRYLDARSTVPQFDIWTSDGGKQNPTWSLALDALFNPLPSRNAIAVSRNGEWIAITDDANVNIWHRPDLNSHNRLPYKIFRLAETATGLAFDELTQELFVLTKSRLLRVSFEPRAEWTTKPDTFKAQRQVVGSPIDGILIMKEDNETFTAENLRSGTQWPLGQAGLSKGKAQIWPGTPTLTITYGPDKNRRTLVVNMQADPPTSAWVDGEPLMIWQKGQAGLFFKTGCDLLFWRASAAVQPISLVSVLPECTKLSRYDMEDKVGALPRGPEGLVLVVPGGHLINIRVADPVLPKIEEVNSNERKLGITWHDDRFFYFNDKGELVVQTEQMGFELRRVALPSEVAEIVRNTARDDNPIHLRLYHAGDERYVVLVDGKCDDPNNASVLLLDTHGHAAVSPYLLQCVNGLPENPEGLNVIWSIKPVGDSVYFGNYFFNGIFRWREGRDLELYAFSERGLQSGAVASRVDLTGALLAGSNVRKINLSKLSDEDLNLGATYIAPSPDGKKIAFFKDGTSSGSSDQKARYLDLDKMQIHLIDNKTTEFFDYMVGVEFSPDGSLLLTKKTDTGYELFQTWDLRRVPLPPGVVFAQFVNSDSLRLTLSNGGILTWHVPETGNEIAFLMRSFREADRPSVR